VTATTTNTTATLAGIGGGLAYYLDPANVYFAGSLLATSLQISDTTNGQNRTVGETDSGFGVELLVGKEWWVSDNWGIGAAAQFIYGAMQDKDTFNTSSPPTWSAAELALLFSASFN
jgi:hypothetical protein